jgi:PPK2 family polyphosphate:nucleotide phosphotransferase
MKNRAPVLSPVRPDAPPPLDDESAAPPDGVRDGDDLARETDELLERLASAQGKLIAEGSRALLVVLQGRDASGKDGLIRKVFGAFNPMGCHVTAFAAPSDEELSHDFLWRVHANAPRRGMVAVFNRSHYEDVLAVRVRELVLPRVWERRFDHINAFERLLVDEGTTVIKFFLHVSRDEQTKRLRKRIEDPRKNWKFRAGDLEDRELWDEYAVAIHDVLARCSTQWAPWYVVPADDKRVRDYLVAQVVAATLDHMDPAYPPPQADLTEYLDVLE